jgi:uncharacterized protein YbaR (Trm112 family)
MAESEPKALEHDVACPHCKAELTFLSPMETIMSARRTCPACKKEFVIEDSKAMRVHKKPSEKASRN